jgi:hypothetical protein
MSLEPVLQLWYLHCWGCSRLESYIIKRKNFLSSRFVCIVNYYSTGVVAHDRRIGSSKEGFMHLFYLDKSPV